jgi:hypothetical protein
MQKITLPLLPCLFLFASGVSSLHAQDDIFLSGASLSFVPLINGEITADGQDTKWDSGYRVELHLRDYYFRQQNHHPFAEIGLFYETHDTTSGNFTLNSETIALRGALGSSIPLWRTADEYLVMGVTPEMGAHVGTLSMDAKTAGLHSSDDGFRYGASVGLSGWMALNRSFSLGVGVIGSYWRATSMTLTVPNGSGTQSRSDTPSGWDVGIRLSAGFVF